MKIPYYSYVLTYCFLIECDFEENHLCGYMNSWNPNVNWFVGGGNIRNAQAIMPKDHTLNSEQGKSETEKMSVDKGRLE